MEVLGKLSDAFATVDGLSAFHYYGSAIEDGLEPGSMRDPRRGGHRCSPRPAASLFERRDVG